MGNANGTSPLDNMRSLEHYLNDLMRGAGDTPDHLKGNKFTYISCFGDVFRRAASCTIIRGTSFVQNVTNVLFSLLAWSVQYTNIQSPPPLTHTHTHTQRR